MPVLVLLQGELRRAKAFRWSVQADSGLQCFRSSTPIDLLPFPCCARILDAPLHSLAVLSPQRCAWCGVFTFCCKGSLPTAFLYGVLECHTSCRAARCDHGCVSYRRTYSSKFRSRASKGRLVRRFYDLLQGEFAPRFSHPLAQGTWPLIPRDSNVLPSRAAWFQIPLYQTHLQ